MLFIFHAKASATAFCMLAKRIGCSRMVLGDKIGKCWKIERTAKDCIKPDLAFTFASVSTVE
jgi:hypothetical protein